MSDSPNGLTVALPTVRRALVFCTVFFGVSVAVIAVGASAAPPVTGDAAQSTATDNATELIVRFEPAPESSETISPQTTRTLKQHANQTQAPFRDRFGRPDANISAATAEAQAVEIKREFWLANAILISVDTSVVPIDTLREPEGVVRVHQNVPIVPAGTQRPHASVHTAANTTSTTYGLRMIEVPDAWETYETYGGGVTVAVVDSGVSAVNPDLSVARWAEFADSGSSVVSTPNDPTGHGTHVAGTIAGDPPSAANMTYGVAPNATLYAAKVIDDDGTGTFAQVLAGMEWAVAQNETDILHMSIGGTMTEDLFIEPVTNARAEGILVVASVGNFGPNTSVSPADLYDTVSVGAVSESGSVPPFSSSETIAKAGWETAPERWPETYTVPSVVAPGVGILSATPGSNGTTQRRTGTSMSAAHVTGTAALALAASDRSPTPDELADALRSSATDSAVLADSGAIRYGAGLIDAPDTVDQLTDDPPGWATPYTDANATVTTDGLFLAAEHWRTGTLTTDRLFKIADAWRTGVPPS